MAAQITELITPQGNFSLVRDKIAVILAEELAQQQSIAPGKGGSADNYKADVYTERFIPFEKFLNNPSVANQFPIINVWFDSSDFDKTSSNSFERQTSKSIYNIDIYGYGQSTETAEGHDPGDMLAAINVQRISNVCRAILMSPPYVKLDLLGLVGDRWVSTITQFQPEFGAMPVEKVIANRLTVAVSFNEFAPQYEAETISEIAVDIIRDSDGKVLAQVEYDFDS